MSVASGQTQGWSFSLEHNDAPDLAWDRNTGRVYLAYTQEDVDGSADTNIYLKYSDVPLGGPPTVWSHSSTQNGIRVNNDTSGKSQFFHRIAVDRTPAAAGTVVLSWYDARQDPQNRLVRFYAAYSTDGGLSFPVNCEVSMAASDGANVDQVLGHYTALDFRSGVFFPVWGDNSANTSGPSDVFTKKVMAPPTCGPGP
jgi:hypothetical protein